MPIRHCQKCGLKVLIDESQAGANPFYCQRCTTAMKSSEQPEPAAAPSGNTPVRREVPQAVAAPEPSPSPSPSSVPAPSRATVKVLCPYCKASFNGRIPQKPARGACPVCQKELILLPNGDIRPSAGFDVSKWQDEEKAPPPPPPPPVREPEPVPARGPAPASEKQNGTRLLIKKYAAEPPPAPARPAASADPGTRVLSPKQAEPTPLTVSKSSEPTELQADLPEWLDDKKPAARPTTDELIESKERQRDPARTEVNEELPAEPVPKPRPAPARPKIVIKPQAAPPPPPPEPAPEPDLLPEPQPEMLPPAPAEAAPPEPPPPPSRPGPGVRRLGQAPRPEPAAAPSAASGGTGGGKVFVAWAIVLLPLIACPVLLNARDKFTGSPIEKVGGMFAKGFLELDRKLNPPPPPPRPPPPPPEEKKPEPPPPPPPPDPQDQKKAEIEISRLFNEANEMRRKTKEYERTAVTPADKQAAEKMRADVAARDSRVQQLRENYKKMYNQDYDPANPR